MSSASPQQFGAFAAMADTLVNKIEGGVTAAGGAGLSPRQRYLNRLWAFYCAVQYDGRALYWDGSTNTGFSDREVIARGEYLPPGFIDASGAMSQTLPLRYRRPIAPYHLARVVVNRFTGLLFSDGKNPAVQVLGDEETEEWFRGLIADARVWSAFEMARNYGGAMGSACLIFRFDKGRPMIDALDPRWLTPRFKDMMSLDLAAVEQRYAFPRDELNAKGKWETVWYWHRRVIDDQADTVFRPVRVSKTEPNWDDPALIARRATHAFGECPGVWIQNIRRDGDIDGEPDCQGIYDAIEEMDGLLSSASVGVKNNCDPTTVIADTDTDLDQVRKGPDWALKLNTGGSATFLEMSGSGIQRAAEMFQIHRTNSLEVVQCVLEHPDVANRTATEIERLYSSMFQRAGQMREQYGQHGVLPLLQKMKRAALTMQNVPLVGPHPQTGQTVQIRRSVMLTPRLVDGKLVERTLGDGAGIVELQWPRFVEPGLQDAQQATSAATAALAGGLLDREHAVDYVAPFFNVKDPGAMLETIRQEMAAQSSALESSLFSGMPGGDPLAPAAPEPAVEKPEPITSAEMEQGLFTINEYRRSRGYAPQPGMDITLPELRATRPELFALSAMAQKGDPELLKPAEPDAAPAAEPPPT